MKKIAVIGRGKVGRALLQIIERRALERDALKVVLIAGRDRYVSSRAGFSREHLFALLANGLHSNDITWYPCGGFEHSSLMDALDHVDHYTDAKKRLTIVDCTAEDNARFHLACLERGWNVVTANKKPLCGPMQEFRELTADPRRYRYEATVGAGLPIISTMQDLLASGDHFQEIRAAASGTLTFVTSRVNSGQVSFNDAVAEAKKLGYTEPDPADDLSGLDVGRKALILARTAGMRTEMAGVKIRPLDKMPVMVQYLLSYLATVRPAETVSVRLEKILPTDPFASLRGTENMFVFTTTRYSDHPLIIRGPGAGPAVTAAGIYADILKVDARRA